MRRVSLLLLTFALIAIPVTAQAYIGPGAGFALVSSFFILIIAAILAFFSILTLPIRTTYLFFRRRHIAKHIQARRVIVIGFDGLDPILCQQFMDEGRLPNLAQLATTGAFKKLATTTPSISPVAWSTFATGVNPGKHNIFDFFTRNPKNYQPVLSSALISSSKKPKKFGPFTLAAPKTSVSLLRKSTSFWKILGENKIFSTILRVPITFPPEKFYGACLSAMCAPDLRGTQGSFTLLTSHPTGEGPQKGTVIHFPVTNTCFTTTIPGPELSTSQTTQTVSLSVEGTINQTEGTVTLTIDKKTLILRQGIYSPWISLRFKAGRKTIHGIARFLVTTIFPQLQIYITPINIDPEHPDLPISHPSFYSICLAKQHGPFATLGLAEDTWALNEDIIDETAFLTQAYDICQERETAFLDSLAKTHDGLLTNVFDTTDRIQHMFFRYLDPDHPANHNKDTTLHQNAIAEVYERSDQLVGKALATISDKDLLLIISDHGFKTFKWGVNLNTWLWQEGYLVLKDGATPGAEWFADVDWTKTQAFAFGLAGIFINTQGREKHGIVPPGAKKLALIQELKGRLEDLVDPARGIKPIRRALLANQELSGPYTKDAPDIFPGYDEGYRVSWNSAIGKISDQVIEPNSKRWSGDHCLDRDLVPGVIFSNWQIDDDSPALIDLAPTILNIFGLRKQKFQDGKVLTMNKPAPGPRKTVPRPSKP
ncbi:MAG: alkaline phosphatase family protein [Proteobacteria bacterium]|nr:nucleotide pyrophosphatase [Desulfobulbaceae bacterium]MBU4153873.1 alkaline phosphatase family protein [Pseudomonadota bacterium]MDP2105421.1 alkaline phosphatase family protein [Desulfobulbaceae bacterium]